MEWGEIINILIGVLTVSVAVIGLPLALRKRKGRGPAMSNELYLHLQESGLDVFFSEEETGREKIGIQRFSSSTSLGLIGARGKNFEWINLVGVSTQYGTNYFLDFQVSSRNLDIRKPKKTRLKKKSFFKKKDATAVWTGDKSFSMSLELDYNLGELIKQSEIEGNLEIIPEPKHNYTRIRIPYFLPSPELLEAINIIAGHVKSNF